MATGTPARTISAVTLSRVNVRHIGFCHNSTCASRWVFIHALRHLTSLTPGDAGISAITLAELAFGAEKSRDPERNRLALAQSTVPLVVAPFEERAASEYGGLRERLERTGESIGSLDTLIAAHALSLGVTLVSWNTNEYRRVPGLKLDDWRE
jgi:tRNA(fMet)-specific endonuclease VapC